MSPSEHGPRFRRAAVVQLQYTLYVGLIKSDKSCLI